MNTRLNLFTRKKWAAVAVAVVGAASLLFLAALTSCAGKGGGDVTLLESITNGEGGVIKKFEYDDQNRIVKIYAGENSENISTIAYGADNSVTVEDVSNDGSKSVKKLVMNGNTVTVEKVTLTINKEGALDSRKDEGRVGLYENEKDKNGDFAEGAYLEKYEYQDGNMTGESDNSGDPEFSMGTFRSYNYDDKKSPFSNSNTPKWLLQYLVEPYYASKNNVIKSHSGGGDYAVMFGYAYEYDGDGFPAKKTAEYDEESVGGGDDAILDGTVTRFTYLVKTKPGAASQPKSVADAGGGAAVTKTVSNAREFIASLGSDRVIALKPGTYNLSEVEAGVAPGGVSLTSEYGRSEVTLTGFRNLTIRGEGRAKDGSPLAKIIVDPRDVEILRFFNCSGIAIDGIAAGHSEGGECSSGVFYFEGSSRITINGTAMFGSGAVGLSLHNVSDMKVTDSRIYECTFDILRIYGGGGIAFEKCAFDNNVVGVYVKDAKNISFADCKFSGNSGSKMFYVVDATVSVSRCAFSGNKTEEPVGNSENVTFSDCEFDDSFADKRDGKVYKTVKMPDGKKWMAQNLNYKAENSWCYDNDSSKCGQYGRLYDWKTAKTACPAGWHLPSRQDWDILSRAAGGERVPGKNGLSDWKGAGKKLKSSGGWENGGDGTDDYGFSAMSGGYRSLGGGFLSVGASGRWWTSDQESRENAYDRNLLSDEDYVGSDYSDKGYGRSVRCVED